MNHTAVWFELPTTDLDRATRFYEAILATQLKREDMGEMRMAIFNAHPEAVTGCLIAHPESKPSDQGAIVYLNGGDDLTQVLDRIEAAGGKVIIPKTLITPEIGYFAQFIDTEGNRVGLHSLR